MRKSCVEQPDGLYVHYEVKRSEGSGFDLIISKGATQIRHHFESTREYDSLVDELGRFGLAVRLELNGAYMEDYIIEED